MSEKSDKVEFDARVDIVYQLYLQGWTSAQIVPYGSEKWGVSDRQVRDYLKSARARIRALHKDRQKSALADMIARHDDLRSRFYKVSDLRGVLEVDKEDAKLLGLYPPEKKEVTGKDGGPIETKDVSELTDEERAERIAALLDRARTRRDGPASSDAA